MITIRSINAKEIDYFVTLADPPTDEHGAIDKRILTELWESGKSRPKWCFVAEEDGNLVGRISYTEYEYPATVEPFQIKLPWTGDYLAIGTMLLRESLKAIQANELLPYAQPSGATVKSKSPQLSFIHLTRDLSSWLKEVDKQRTLFDAVGIPLVQKMAGFEWFAPKPPVALPTRLHFRPLDDLSDQTFIEAIRRAMIGTLDRFLQIFADAIDPAEDYHLLKERFDFKPAWWQLAYTNNDELVGLIQPVLFHLDQPADERKGLIAVLGVVPEQRGNGYINDLLARATATLQSVNVQMIYAQTDLLNSPMLDAFERLDYERTSTIWKYHAKLEELIAGWENQ